MSSQSDRINYYRILGVSEDTHPDQIKLLYRELARQHHPDVRGASADNLEWFQHLTAAYHTLSDARRKAAYDEQLKARLRNNCSSGSLKEARYRRRPTDLTLRTVRRKRSVERLLRYTFGFTRA